MVWVALLVFAFLAGSVPFGLLIAKAKGVDIRAQGSGNIGATNVGRVLGRRFGFLCFGLDALKGAVPVLVAGGVTGLLGRQLADMAPTDGWLWLAVGVSALLGHMFSPWIGFKGGKGVATGFGALVAMWTPLTIPSLIALGVWVVFVKLLRMVSIASILAALSIPISVAVRAILSVEPEEALRASIPALVVTAAIALLVVWKHRANIGRALRGEELKVKV